MYCNESLKSSSNYPLMSQSQWDSAPFNQSDPEDKEFEVTCSQSLSKTVKVVTNNYIPGESNIDYEKDDEGGTYASSWHDVPDTSDTNWAEEYHSNDYHTPLQLIQFLGQVLENDLKNGIVFKNPKFTQDLINECNGWCEDETEYIKN